MSSDLAQFAPLSQSLVRSLTDKLYEKRKAAALEIEKQVKEYVKSDNFAELERLLSVLESLTLSANTNSRKGGLIGLAATAIALGRNGGAYAPKLMEPVFTCFTDADPRVRYFACEALYNIVKICRTSALTYFSDLFDILWKLSSDTDQNVRSGSELLDKLVKEIVVSAPHFDLEQLMVLIREHIYVVNSSNRRFIISWLNTVLSVPAFSIHTYIPEVIDGVFKALEDPSQAVRDITTVVLTELLHKIDPTMENDVNIGAIVKSTVVHATSMHTVAREMGIAWLNEICKNYDNRVLPNLAFFLIAVLPLIGDSSLQTDELNDRLIELVKSDSQLPVDAVVEVLLKHLRHEKVECRVASLNWIRHLHYKQSNQMFRHMGRFFPVFLELLADSADEVLMLDIMLISEICGQNQHTIDVKSLNLANEIIQELKGVSPYLIKFTINLLKMFYEDGVLLEERGVQIMRQVCLLLNPADVYRSVAILITHSASETSKVATPLTSRPFTVFEGSKREQPSGFDYGFIAKIVEMLNQILLTTFELYDLRQYLRNPEANDCAELFEKIYRCWCHQPICLLSLCLLSQNYSHAVDIVYRLADIDVTVNLLTEIDRLVQLIESPILSYVRMDLLSAEHQKPLAGVLSALLMLLPQTDAFNTLHKRLQAVPHLALLDQNSAKQLTPTAAVKHKIPFKELLIYFDKITTIRSAALRQNHRKLLSNLAS